MERRAHKHGSRWIWLVVVAVSLQSAPAVVFVNPIATGAANGTSWTDAYPSLAAALSLHVSEEFWVAAGMHTPGPAATNSFALQDHRLYGGFVGTETTRDARDPAQHLTILSGNLGGGLFAKSVLRKTTAGDAQLDGLIVRDGFSTVATDHGAGLLMTTGALHVVNVLFTNNIAGGSGGALHLNGGNVLITHSRFFNNSNKGHTGVTYGGAIFADSAVTAFTLTHCVFSGNESDNTAGDVRIGAAALHAIVEDCSFEGTRAPNEAGSFASLATGGNTLRRLDFRNIATTLSTVNTYGGAILLNGAPSNTLEDCRFDTVTLAGRSGGGAVAIGSGEVQLTGCTFTNVAAGYINAPGGALHVFGTTAHGVVVSNSTFATVSCGSGASGGAISILGRMADVTLTDCTFTQVTGGTHGGAIATASTARNVFRDLTFRDVQTTNGTGNYAGGALYSVAGTENIVEHGHFANITHAGRTGGGGAYLGAGVVHVTDCTFTNIVVTYSGASSGGALMLGATQTNVIRNVTFTDIRLEGNGSGGALHVADGETTLDACTFTRIACVNSLGDSAVAIANGTAVPRAVTVTNCTFDTVTAGSGAVYGGALQVLLRPDDVTITDCTFTNITTGAGGGALYLTTTRLNTIRHCVFRNVATTTGGAYSGGAVHSAGGGTNRIDACVFEDISLAGSGDGGALYISTGVVDLRDSEFRRTGGAGLNLDGGAVYIAGTSADAVSLSNCVFAAATAGATARGGALYVAGRAAPVTLMDTHFSACGAGYDGGAVYIASPTSPQERRIDGCTFSDNVVSALTYDGGALFVANGSAGSGVRDSTFISNRVSATGQGGALYQSSGLLDMEDSRFVNNTAQSGGALFQATAQAAGTTNRITGCDFRGNRADGGNGGALYLTGDSALGNTLFTGNVQTGGLFGGGGLCLVAADGRTVRVTHSTFHGNMADPAGAGLQLESGSASVHDSIFADNTVAIPARFPSHDIHIDAGDTLTLAHTLADLNRVWAEGTLIDGGGVFVADPRFQAPAEGDLHLRAPFGRWDGAQWVYTDLEASLAIDRADPASAFDQEPPPNGGRANLGRYGNTVEASKSAFAGLIVVNRAASDITPTSATLRGELLSLDNPPTLVRFGWGPVDGGTNLEAWATVETVSANQATGHFARAVGPLQPDTVYYYRAVADTAGNRHWAQATERFSTAALTVTVTQPAATEEGPVSAVFTISRPPTATNTELLVNYALGGTATAGADYAPPTGSVLLPVGSASVDVTVLPVDDVEVEPAAETLTLTLLPGAYGVGVPAAAGATITDNDALDGFAHRMRITFHRYSKNEPLSGFPALVVLHEGVSFFRYADLAAADGGDLRFANDSLTELLPHEVERWNPGGESPIWVRVPALERNTPIWVLWGRPGATNAPVYTRDGSVWSTGSHAVLHLGEAVTDGQTNVAAHADSSAGDRHGTQRGNAPAAGRIGLGQDLATGDSVHLPNVQWAPKTYSVMFWLQARSLTANGQLIGAVAGWNAFNFHTAANGVLYAGTDTATRFTTGAGALTVGPWHAFAFTFDNGQARFYRNGQLLSTRNDMNTPINWNGFQLSTSVDGVVDELRIASVARSSNWVWACHANQSDPLDFAPLGLGWPLPVIDTGNGALTVSHNSATLDGNLLSTGASPTTVWVHWGTTDGGTDPLAWQQALSLGARDTGSVSTAVGGLTEFTHYFYRLRAVNTAGTTWAESTRTFRTRIDLAAIAGTNYLGTNMDFETPMLQWTGDPHSYVTTSFDSSFAPMSGAYMLRMLGTGGGDNCDISGSVDLSRYVDAITNGNVEFSFTIHYNRIAEFLPAAPVVDTGVFANTGFLDRDDFIQNNFGWDPAWGNMLIADNDTNTWESATVTGIVPPTAVQARFRLSWAENVFNDNGGTEFWGQYYDNIRFALIVPSYAQPPATGFLILVH